MGLGLNEAAYMAEISRAGIQSVNDGQVEAAHALVVARRRQQVEAQVAVAWA